MRAVRDDVFFIHDRSSSTHTCPTKTWKEQWPHFGGSIIKTVLPLLPCKCTLIENRVTSFLKPHTTLVRKEPCKFPCKNLWTRIALPPVFWQD